MKKNVLYILLFVMCVSTVVVSCDNQDPFGDTIFIDEQSRATNFDKYITDSFRLKYNIDVLYKFTDIESDMTYNLAPAKLENAQLLAQIVKHVWLESYDELAGIDFTRKYAPKILMFIGSGAYDNRGAVVLGTAEGGLKVSLYLVNSLVLNPDFLNKTYFHTMHHEFAHILHQTKSYDQDFKLVTDSSYVGGDWLYVSEAIARSKGYVSPYSMYEANEDFVEMYSFYVTNTSTWWTNMLASAGKGAPIISRKLEYVRTYFKEKWSIDIDQMRDIVLRRSNEVTTYQFLDFK